MGEVRAIFGDEKFKPLNDIPGRLRQLADEFERGEHERMCALLVTAVPLEGFTPQTWCFGYNEDRHRIAGLFLHLAQLTLTDD